MNDDSPQAQPPDAPERIWISAASLPRSRKDGVGSFYPNFSGDTSRFDLIEYVRADLPRAAADGGSDDWCDDCHAYSHLPFCPSYRSRNDPLVDRLFDAVYRSMQQYEDGTWLLDNLKAKARVKRILTSVPRATETLTVEAALAELRELSQTGDYPPYIGAGFGDDRQPVFVISYGTYRHAEGKTLDEAMREVRAWAKSRAGRVNLSDSSQATHE